MSVARITRLVAAGFVVVIIGTADADAEIRIGVPAPLTGPVAWGGEETERGVKMAVEELNERGGLLGQPVQTIIVDDYCDPEQAVAAAKKLVAEKVDVVIGHVCSGAAIAASKLYNDAGILLMTATATNPLLTEQGFANVFRFCGRDDQQGTMAGRYLAEHWGDKKIAILHDGQSYGQGLARETKRSLNAHGVSEVLFQSVVPGMLDYVEVIEIIQAADIDVLYYGGYSPEAGLMIRQLRQRGNELQLIAGDGIVGEDFGLIAGDAAEDTLFTSFLDARELPRAAKVVAAFRSDGYEPKGGTLLYYAAVHAWAQAIEKAGTLKLSAVIKSLRSNQFDTLYGHIGFDDKGDVTGYEPFAWYVWKNGDYAPIDPAAVLE
jgi:branched-chain amino acid transport system substrate-binding protein